MEDEDIKIAITKQLQQLQAIMQRTAFRSDPDHSSFRGQGRVLSILMDQHQITLKELEEKTGCSRQALAEILQKMQKSGYVFRQPDPRDKRVHLICITPKGVCAAKESNHGFMEISTLLECLNDDELSDFSDILSSILYNAKSECPDSCNKCTGPESCNHDYLKFGHEKPNPRFCKYARYFK